MNGSDVDVEIAALCADLEQLYRDHEVDVAEEWLRLARALPAYRARVAVVGEVGAGKTALINAALGRAGLLPVQPTRHFVGVGAGEPEGVRLHLADGGCETVGLEELAGAMSSLDRESAAIDHIEVLLDEPTLAGLTLFDTPGFGGLDAKTTSNAISALEDATAVIFVCAAGEKISLADRDFLVQAAQRIEHVVFVLSKIDIADDGGQANLAENMKAIQSRLPHRTTSLSSLAVSSVLAAEGELGDAESHAESGIEALRARLREIVLHQDSYAQRNSLRQIRQSISAALAVKAHRLRRLRAPRATEDEIAAAQIRLTDLGQHREEWRTLMGDLLEDAKYDLERESDSRKELLLDEYKSATRSAKDLAAIEMLEKGLSGALEKWQKDIERCIAEKLKDLTVNLQQGLVSVDIEALLADVASPDIRARDCLKSHVERRRNTAQTLQEVQGGIAPFMWMRTIFEQVFDEDFISALESAAPPGIALAFVKRKNNKKAEARVDAEQRFREAILTASQKISKETTRQLQLYRRQLVKNFAVAIDSARRQVNADLKALTDDEKARDTQLKRVLRLEASLDQHIDRWNLLYDEMHALPAPAGPASPPPSP
jgi:predicted GTPase